MSTPIECEPHHQVYATNSIDPQTGRHAEVVLCIEDFTTESTQYGAAAILTPSQAKAIALQLLEAADRVGGDRDA